MKKLMAVVLSMMCAACAPVVTKVSVPDIAKSDSLSVRDVRPVGEKDRKLFSLLITSKEYGIIRTGDTLLSPSPIRLLQYQAFGKFNVSGHLPRVDVYHFVVYENAKSQLRAGAVGAAVGGVLGGLAANEIANHDALAKTEIVDERTFDGSSGSDEYQRGLYTEAENPQKGSVYIIYIDTDIDGKRVLTRTVSPMKPHGDENTLVNAVQSAIANHLAHYSADVPAVGAASLAAPAMATVADANPTAAPSSSQAVVASADATVSGPATLMSPQSSAAVTAMAQGVANQLGCGAVRANGDSTFVAPCGGHGVLIDCDGGQCRPMHTVSIKSEE